MADNRGNRSSDLKPEAITDLEDQNVVKSFEDRTDGRSTIKKAALLTSDDASDFSPMIWPVMDDGKELTTNALGYPTGGYFALQKKKEEEQKKKEEQERRAREEAEAREREALEAPKLTAEELEAIRKAAYDEGLSQGVEEGRASGYQDGFEKAREEGFKAGLEEGKEQGIIQGRLAGREEGFKAGFAEGLENSRHLVDEKVSRFAHLGDMLANPLREVNRDVTDEICYLISRLCKVIIHRELSGDLKNLQNAIDRCLDLLPNAEKGAVITLCPDDYDLVMASLGRDYLKAQKWNLQSSDELNPGDVEVSNEISLADFKVNDRIDSLIEKFLDAASEAGSTALRESLPDLPEYNEVPQKPLAPPPNLMAYEKSIAAHLNPQGILQEDKASGAVEGSDKDPADNDAESAAEAEDLKAAAAATPALQNEKPLSEVKDLKSKALSSNAKKTGDSIGSDGSLPSSRKDNDALVNEALRKPSDNLQGQKPGGMGPSGDLTPSGVSEFGNEAHKAAVVPPEKMVTEVPVNGGDVERAKQALADLEALGAKESAAGDKTKGGSGLHKVGTSKKGAHKNVFTAVPVKQKAGKFKDETLKDDAAAKKAAASEPKKGKTPKKPENDAAPALVSTAEDPFLEKST